MYYRGGRDDLGRVVPGLGIDPVTAYTTYQTANKLLQESRSLWDAHPKDKARFEANLEASQAALQGDASAMAYLHQRTGRYQPAAVSFSPVAYPHPVDQPIAGWATAEPKTDASRKEQQVSEALRGGGGAFAGIGAGGMLPLLLMGGLALAVVASSRGRR